MMAGRSADWVVAQAHVKVKKHEKAIQAGQCLMARRQLARACHQDNRFDFLCAGVAAKVEMILAALPHFNG